MNFGRDDYLVLALVLAALLAGLALSYSGAGSPTERLLWIWLG